MNRKTTVKMMFKSKDYEKFKTNLENLKNAKAVTIRFSLQYFYKNCVDNGSNNKTYCNYLLESKGHLIVINLLQQFQNKENVLLQLLTIINSCLKNIPEDLVAYHLVDSKLTEILINITENSQFPDSKEQALDILNKLSIYEMTHQNMIDQNFLKFLNRSADFFIRKDINALKLQEMIEIARLFDIFKNLGSNDEIFDQLTQSGLIQQIIQIYIQNDKVTFLRDLIVKSLEKISFNSESSKIIKEANLDFQKLSYDCVKSMNAKLIAKLETVIKNLASEEEIKNFIEKAKKKECQDSILVYLSFLSKHEIYSGLFEDYNLLDVLMARLNEPNQSEELKLSIIKIMREVVELDEKHIEYFKQKKGLSQIIYILEDPTDDSYMFIIEILKFFSRCLTIAGKDFANLLEEKKMMPKFLTYFLNLSKQYNQFRIKAVTTQKALDSIEYYKSETTKAILETIKNISSDDIVSMDIALAYISCEQLSKTLMIFFSKMMDTYPETQIQLGDDFFETCLLLMKVFKNSKQVYENVALCLNKINYTKSQGEAIQRLNYFFFLCDKIWTNPQWRFFSLYLLRFVEKMVINPEVLLHIRKNLNCAKLVASIKNFINEEDYKELEEEVVDQNEEEEEYQKDVLTYSEEREIHKKSTEIIGKLMDTVIINTLKDKIGKTIQNFKPIPQTILILRSEYAVLTCANAINHFGCEGLKTNLQDWLKDNIDKIEKSVKYKDFQDKEKLLADCIRSIANYVCITWNETGKNLYQKNQVSLIVFRQFEKYLKQSNKPLSSYVMLQAFKEWLIERIEIIENATNQERMKIYDKESFMMVDEDIRDKLITDVMDSLYGTHQKFSENEKVVKLNFEVIMLLGYIYPEWKSRVGKNFIPQIMEALESENLGKETDIKSIELLKNLTGCDGKSEPNKEMLEAAIQKKGIQIITKSISDNNYDNDYIEQCKPLLEEMGKDEESLETNYDLIDELIQKIRDFNKSGDKGNKEELKKILKVNDQLNAFCMVEPLGLYAFEKGHSQAVNDLWKNIRDKKEQKVEDPLLKKILSDVEVGCAVTMSSHIPNAIKPEDFKKLYNKNNDDLNGNSLLVNSLKALRNNQKNPQMIYLTSKIINNCFPSTEYAKTARAIAKKMNFQPDLENLLKNFGKSNDNDLSTEVNKVYMNLSENQQENIIENSLKKNLMDLKQSLNDKNLSECVNNLNHLLPFANQDIFCENFDELDILEYILRMLKLLHKNTNDKTQQTSKQLVKQALSSLQTPDLGDNNKKILEEDIKLAKTLTHFILSLPEEIKEKVRNHKEIVKLSDIAAVLNGSTQSYELFGDYLKNPENVQILRKQKLLECATFLLMKNNQDSFKKEEMDENQDLSVSTLNMKTSNLNVSDLRTSRISALKAEDKKDEIINRNVNKFGMVIEEVLSPNMFNDLLEQYIGAMNKYQANDKNQLRELLSISRIISAIFSSQDSYKLDLNPYAKKLNQAFQNFLRILKHEKVPNKKLLKFFEQNFNYIAKALDGSDKEMRNSNLWNQLVERYFVLSPGLIKNNPETIFENLTLTIPKDKINLRFEDKFVEKSAQLDKLPSVNDNGSLNEENAKKVDLIVPNFYKAIASNAVQNNHMVKNLECLTKSANFCKQFVQTPYFQKFVDHLNESNDLEDAELFSADSEILNNVVVALKVEKDKNFEINSVLDKFYEIPSEELLSPFITNLKENKKPFLDCSINSLNYLNDVMKNKSIYFDSDLPQILLNQLGKDWKGKENLAIMLCKTLNDSSLAKKYQAQNLFKQAKDNLENNLFKENSIIKNPKQFSDFKAISDLDSDKQKKNIELNAYIFGEMSRIKENAKSLADCENSQNFNVFQLYYEFEKYGHIPIIATKIIEGTRNGVYQLSDETMEANEDKVNDLIDRIPYQIKKYDEFVKTPQFLKDILDYLKNFKKHKTPQSALTRLIKQFMDNKKLPEDRLKDLNELAQLYKELSEKLENNPLNNQESKILELLNQEVTKLLNQPNSEAPYSLFNLDVAKHLRLIANSPHSLMSEKDEALELLNNFAANKDIIPKMLKDDFYVKKSAELIDDLLKNQDKLSKLPEEVVQVLDKDLQFMKKLTDDPQGVRYALDNNSKELPLIEDLFKILESDSPDEKLKIDALQVLKNLLKFGDNKKLESDLLQKLNQFLNANENLYNLFTELVDLAGELSKKSPENKKKLIEKKILENVKNGMNIHRGGDELNSKAAFLVYDLVNNNPDNHAYVFNSEILPLLQTPFQKKDSNKSLHHDVAKTILQLSFKNNDRKQELINIGFIKGLVPLLIHYSSDDHYDEEMISLVLKCMANFSLIPEGVDHLLFDGVIPAFKDFFKKYKEKLPEQNKLMLCTVSNLSYDPQDKFINKIIKDKGLELILDTLEYYTQKKDEEVSEAAIDALTHVSSSEITLKYLLKTKTNAIDILVDILRQQLNGNMVYKSLRCLTRFCEFKPLSDNFIEKRGHAVTVDLFKPYQKDLKNIFQALKLLTNLIDKNNDKLEDFAFAGVPEKIITSFDNEWPLEIIKQLIELFAKMAPIEMVKEILANQFLDDLIALMNKYFKNKSIIRNGTTLLAICSDNITSVNAIQEQKGNELADRILDKYISSESIMYQTLQLMENMIRMQKESKPDFLEMKTDFKVENIVDTTDKNTQPDLNQQAIIVLDLLRDKKFNDIGVSEIVEDNEEFENNDNENETKQDQQIEHNDLEKLVPPDIQKFLKQGRILRVYGEDGVCRSMHFFLSKDMSDLKCKHPKENFVKQKWIIPIHRVKEIKYGYDKKSPIAKSASFFRKAPPPEKCFAVFGPTLLDGPKNFHLLCDNSYDAKKWYDYLTMVLNEYKKLLKKNLNQDKEISQ